MNKLQLYYLSDTSSFFEFLIKFFIPFFLFFTFLITSFIIYFFGYIDVYSLILSSLIGALLVYFLLLIKKEYLKTNIDQNFLFFITFLSSLSVSGEKYKEFFEKVAENEDYGEISKEMKLLNQLATKENLGYSKACDLISKITPSEIFRRFLIRLRNIIEFGESLYKYLVSEQDKLLRELELEYEKTLHTISFISEVYSSIVISLSFLFVFVISLPLFLPGSEIYVTYAVYVVLIFDVFFIILSYFILPKSTLKRTEGYLTRQGFITEFSFSLAIFLGIIIFHLTSFLGFSLLRFALAATPLIIPGILAREEEKKIKEMEDEFSSFVVTYGRYLSLRKGSPESVLGRILEYLYGSFKDLVDGFWKRLRASKNEKLSWKYFSDESGSKMISSLSHVFFLSREYGSDPEKVGNILKNSISRIVSVRDLRQTTAKSSKINIYVVFVGFVVAIFLAYYLFGFMTGLFTTVAEVKQKVSLPEGLKNIFLGIYFVNMPQVYFSLILVIVLHAFFSSLFIKQLDGGIWIGFSLHFAIFLWIAYFIQVLSSLFFVVFIV